MKAQDWIGYIVALVIFLGFFRSCSGDAVTERYLTDCYSVIADASIRADKAWTTSGKLSIMEEAFTKAASIEPPLRADRGTVVRMQQVLKEGREYFATADGEWTWARDFAVGFIGAAVDASGGGGAALATLLTVKGAEIASDDTERREFIEACKELERYLNDK